MGTGGRRAGVDMEISLGIPMDMGIKTAMNLYGSVGILWGFLNECNNNKPVGDMVRSLV